MDTRGRPWWWSVGPALAIGSVGVAAIQPHQLADSGLAFVVVVALTAVLPGALLARESWFDEDFYSPYAETESAFSKVAVWGSIAALATAGTHDLRLIALLVAVLFGLSLRRLPWVGQLGWAVTGMAVLLLGIPLFQGDVGWTTLTPSLHTIRDWGSSALTLGLLIGWVPSFWRAAGHSGPGRANTPFIVAGLGVLSAMCVSWMLASQFEVQLGSPVVPLFTAWAGWIAALVLSQHGTTRPVVRFLVPGALFAFFSVTHSSELWWTLAAPMLLATAAGLRALRTRSVSAAATTLMLVVAVVAGTFEGPRTVGEGFQVAAPWVFAFWIGATQALRART